MGLIRLLLALSVVVTHADLIVDGTVAHGGIFGLRLVGGQAAVQAFYVISGFYMALVLNRKYPVGAAGYRTFISARLLRLFPAYAFVLVLTLILAQTRIVPHPAWERWQTDAPTMNAPTIALYAGSQATLVGQDAVWFTEYDTATGTAQFRKDPRIGPASPALAAPDALLPPSTLPVDPNPSHIPTMRPGYDFLFVGQAWTLGVELMFYCVAPFVVRRIGWIAILFLLSWGVRLTLAHYGMRHDPWSYRFFPSELAMFLMGSAAYHAYAWMDADTLRKVGRVAWPAMVLLILFLFELQSLPLKALITATAMACCVPFVFALTKDRKVDRWIGELSYPVYITHETVRLGLEHYAGHVNVYALVAATLVASVLLMLGVEQPFERVRAKFVARRRARITAEPDAATPTPPGRA